MRKPGKKAKHRMIAAMKGAPAWLQPAIIGERIGRPNPIRGTFGAASPVISIDPHTGQPREPADPQTQRCALDAAVSPGVGVNALRRGEPITEALHVAV